MGFAGRPVGRGALGHFLRALSCGRMGLDRTSRGSFFGAAIPPYSECFAKACRRPHNRGFVLAAAGIWLISRTRDDSPTEGIGMAALAGIGFSRVRYLCMKQAGRFGLLAGSDVEGSVVHSHAAIVLIGRIPRNIEPASGIGFGRTRWLLAIIGSVLFISCQPNGRLDAAVVLSSLYPAHLFCWRASSCESTSPAGEALGMIAALLAVPMIAWR